MNAAVFLGVGLGTGLTLALAGLFPARPPLAVALARLHAPRARHREHSPESLVVRMLGRPLARTDFATWIANRTGRDLRVVGRTPEEMLAKQALTGLFGLLWAPATAGLMALGGVAVAPILPLWIAAVLAIIGFLLPVAELKVAAAARRRSFRHALSCFLDLVAVRLAGGAGVESALATSAQGGNGWAFVALRQALTEARLMGDPPWVGLDRLGSDLDIAELNELAASVTLAGDEGARVRASIAAKARSIRTHGLAEAESAAQAASERMSLPIVLLMVGFVVFLGYPAVMQVLTGL